MLAALSCDPSLTFSSLCEWLDSVGHTDIVGPVTQRVLGPVLALVAVVFLGRLLRGFLERAIERAGGDPQVRTLVHNIVVAVTWIIAVVSALIAAGLNPSFLLTFGGVSTLAVGLAFQDLLRNVLAGMFILVERPFKIGDLISVEDCTGTVLTIRLRTTALRTGDGRLAILPNLTAFNGVVLNASAFDTRRFSITIALPPDLPLDKAIAAARRELTATKVIAKEPAPTLTPRMDPDGHRSLVAAYWLQYRDNDADAVAADLGTRLWKVAEVS
jgi:small conductance mechanosensitive channel